MYLHTKISKAPWLHLGYGDYLKNLNFAAADAAEEVDLESSHHQILMGRRRNLVLPDLRWMSWVSSSKHRECHWRGTSSTKRAQGHSSTPKADAGPCSSAVQRLLQVRDLVQVVYIPLKSVFSILCHTGPSENNRKKGVINL